MEKEVIIKDNIKIENLIYDIRGKQVMLDSDVATLYKVETKRINESVKNNRERFPNDFCFQLTVAEYNYILRSKNSTLYNKNGQGQHRKYLPYAFTEQGVAMLSGIIKNKIAIRTSIKIMNAFVMMRKYISSDNYEKRLSNVETKIIDYDNKFDEVFNKLDKSVNNHIFFEGQIYDSYSLLLKILNTAEENITIIDNYIDKNLSDILSKIKKKVIIYTNNIDKTLVLKYQKQYDNVKIIIKNNFHDRFIIIDNVILYHCGASFKDLGKRCFAITKIEELEILSNLMNKLKIDE